MYSENVTLGINRGVSSIVNNVTVFTGSIVVSEITLNDGCVIGANSFVNCSMSPKNFSCWITGENY